MEMTYLSLSLSLVSLQLVNVKLWIFMLQAVTNGNHVGEYTCALHLLPSYVGVYNDHEVISE